MPGLFNNSMGNRNKATSSFCVHARIPFSHSFFFFYTALGNALALISGRRWQTEAMMKNGKEVYCRAGELVRFPCYPGQCVFDNREFSLIYNLVWRKRLAFTGFQCQASHFMSLECSDIRRWDKCWHCDLGSELLVKTQNHRCCFSQHFQWRSYQSHECNELSRLMK